MTPLNWAEVAGGAVVLVVILRNLKGMHELTGAAPKSGPGPEEVAWHRLKDDGETVHPGDIIADTQVNSSHFEIQAHHMGTLRWIVQEGQLMASGSVIATIDHESESVPVTVPKEYFER